MNIVVNGKQEEVEQPSTLADLVRRYELAPQRVAIEVNEQLVPRQTYEDVTLCPNDRVEIVTFVGGG